METAKIKAFQWILQAKNLTKFVLIVIFNSKEGPLSIK
jgi:hypothetical protein